MEEEMTSQRIPNTEATTQHALSAEDSGRYSPVIFEQEQEQEKE